MSSTNNNIPAVDRTIVYIDGYNLYHGMLEVYDRTYMWLDLAKFAQGLLSDPKQQLMAVKYFTSHAPGGNKSGSWRRQQRYWNALGTRKDLVEIVPGQYREKAMRCKACQTDEAECRKCGAKLRYRNEKRTDVNIATHLVRDACCGSCDVAILVGGDTDLIGAVGAARAKIGRVVVAFPPNRYNDDMAQAASGSFKIKEGQFKNAQFDDRVEVAPGVWVERPNKWR